MFLVQQSISPKGCLNNSIIIPSNNNGCIMYYIVHSLLTRSPVFSLYSITFSHNNLFLFFHPLVNIMFNIFAFFSAVQSVSALALVGTQFSISFDCNTSLYVMVSLTVEQLRGCVWGLCTVFSCVHSVAFNARNRIKAINDHYFRDSCC